MKLAELIKTWAGVQKLPDAPGGYAVYGAGSAGREICRILAAKKLAVKFIMDRNAEKTGPVDGIRVITPESAKKTDTAGMCAVIGLFNGNVNCVEIEKLLTDMGFGSVLSFYDLYHIMPWEFGEKYFMAPRAFLEAHVREIDDAAGIWADARSRELFENVMAFRYTGDMKYSPGPEKNGFNYFPGGIPGWELPENFIDCGAFTGDTLLDILKHGGKMKSAAVFEPDAENFRVMSDAVRAAGVAADLKLFQKGVYSSAGQLRFAGIPGGASRISGEGESVIETVTLDEALPGYKPDIIKMDIEGAEPEALKGGMEMIKKHRPNLAVCVYHRPEHIWEIPRMIKDWNLGYRLYLRSYNYHSFEIVLHAVKG